MFVRNSSEPGSPSVVGIPFTVKIRYEKVGRGRGYSRSDFILGEDVREFEKEFAAFNQAPHCIGVADGTDALHLALLALGSGLVNPASTGLISLYASAAEQGRILGIFRSLGSLSRAITPILAGTAFWMFGSRALFVSAAILSTVAWALSKRLPQPVK